MSRRIVRTLFAVALVLALGAASPAQAAVFGPSVNALDVWSRAVAWFVSLWNGAADDDQGHTIDPNGLTAATSDQGHSIDPNGLTAPDDDKGWTIDPDG